MQENKDSTETDDIRWNAALEHWLYGLILNGFGQNNLRKSGPRFMNTSACPCPLDSKFLFWVPLADQQQCYPNRSSLPIYMAVTLSRNTHWESLVHSQPEAQFLPTVFPQWASTFPGTHLLWGHSLAFGRQKVDLHIILARERKLTLFCIIFETVSLCGTGWSGTHNADQATLKLRDPPALPLRSWE